MKLSTRVQNLDEAVCISLHANSLGKSMNESLLPRTMRGKQMDSCL